MLKLRTYRGAGLALFRKEDSEWAILLGKRVPRPAEGKWSIPGGKFDKGKDRDFWEAARREFREETLCNPPKNFVAKMRIRLPFFNWTTFFCIDDGKARISHNWEFSEIRFVPLDELRQYDLAFGVMCEVKAFKRFLRKRRNVVP